MQDFTLKRLKQIGRMESSHFWFVVRKKIINILIRKYSAPYNRIFADIGCGTGFNLNNWLLHGDFVVGVDRLIKESQQHIFNKAISGITADVHNLPIQNSSVELAVCLDVLEHVDDSLVLREIHRILKDGALLVITVPAFSWLWSYRDNIAGHRRRYTVGMIRNLLESLGFVIRYINYYQFLLFPVLVFLRVCPWLSSNKRMLKVEDQPNSSLNRIMTTIMLFEARLVEKNILFPWGSSIVVVARKLKSNSHKR